MVRRLAPLALLILTCKWQLNPNAGHFTCTTAADCGGGWECIAQFSGGSLCFPKGQCVTEECNGKDDNCDGRTDESFPEMAAACDAGLAGPCAAGINVCTDAGVVACRSTYTPVAETCNGIDDDCANGVDDTFSFSSDNLNCGGCGRRCGTGSRCASFVCRETSCADGVDNDDAGDPDCLDSDCLTVDCGLDGGFNCGARLEPFDAGSPDAGDGGIDDGGVDDGGMDAGVMDAGEPDAGFVTVLACVPRESPCDNGVDDDLDGRPDCSDSDCDGKACDGGTCMNGTCR